MGYSISGNSSIFIIHNQVKRWWAPGYEICQRNNIEFKIVSKTLPDRDAAKIWIICNQLSRRNITPAQRSYLLGIQYKLEKQQVGGQLPKGGGQNDPALRTAEKIAKEHHVSPATVKRAEKFAAVLDNMSPEERAEVLAGGCWKTKMETPGEMIRSGCLSPLNPPLS
jgi:hypothetical protein